MKTIHVGGINPIRRVKTLTEAIQKAVDDDTIEIHKNIEESVTVDKNIIIKGNNNTFTVPSGKVGIMANEPIEIYDINFDVKSRANAIVARNNIDMANIDIALIGPIREFYPAIQIRSDRNINAKITNSRLKMLFTGPTVNAVIIDSELSSYYEGDIMLGTREDMSSLNGTLTIKSSRLRSVIIVGDAMIKQSEIFKYVDIDGTAELKNCIFDIKHETVNIKRKYKKEPQNGPLSNETKSKYGLAARPSSELIIDNYTVNETDSGYLGIYASDANVVIKNVNLLTKSVPHKIKDSTISFQDVQDQNYWDITNSTTAYVRSKVNSNQHHVTAKNKLDQLIGQTAVKEQVNSIMNTIEMNRTSSNKDFEFSYNMIFAGSPGTGKSTIARIVAEALFEVGAIPQNKFTTATSDEFVKGYVGQTGENTRKILDSAIGGVLFIDEAYELTVRDGQNSFNSEVLSVLIRYMEEHRSDLVVIAAGYNTEMKEFLASNVGLARRFQWIQFDDYTIPEMVKIFEVMRNSFKDKYAQEELVSLLPPLFTRVVETNIAIPDAKGHITNGGNGGLVRNIYQQIVQARNNRVITTGGTKDFTKEDIATGFKAEIIKAKQRAI